MGIPTRSLRQWVLGRPISVLLTGIVLLAALPAMVVIVLSSLAARQQAEAQAFETLRNLTRSLVAIQQGVDNQAQAVLVTLSHTKVVREWDLPGINQVFTELLGERPDLSGVFLTDATGRVVASGLPEMLGVDMSDRTYIHEAMARHGLGVSEFLFGRATRKPILAFALADKQHGATFPGVIGLTYYLEGYDRFLAGLELPPHARVTLFDRGGRRLVAYPPDARFPLGELAKPHIWAQCANGASDEGVFIDARPSGEEGLFSYARLRLAPDRPPFMTILVASNRADAFAQADVQLRRELLTALAALVLALLIARFAGRAAIVHGIVTLADAAGRLAGGDLSARAETSQDSLEVRRLGQSFNAMAEALETRQKELTQALTALSSMRAMLANILESMPSAIIGLDGAGHVTHVNGAAATLFGLDKATLLGRSSTESLPFLAEYAPTAALAQRERRAITVEKIALSQGGGDHFMDLLFYPLIANGAEGVVLRFDDVTDREKALEEKTTLLKEIHHRVKNNLQIILSFIGLQAEDAVDAAERDRLRRLDLRIRSMAMVHQQLYNSGDFSTIEMAEYAKTLVRGVLAIFPDVTVRVRLVLALEAFDLPLDTAVPCGLLLGELLTNACKHAFPGPGSGVLLVGCRRENGLARFWVEDNGRGLPPQFAYDETMSLGLTLVRELTRQLQGEMVLSRPPGGGLRFEVAFPVTSDGAAGAPA
ncbi:PAS domain S-box protein [Desulfovibrio aerotolerans]|uniref:histidine kinase n=1 Tax=Solidesulfovibrio aerotolerans TaxID=295255 RepID=A0A7C9IMI2_9BACT|nr:histidine kinase dimerization/phosphoacceptor domain -containing protein [Solidesulfovibrio aerotolerans]MYL83626.1 PAS domain S-box protein [Solidesulfovibrio aerotolerans]